MGQENHGQSVCKWSELGVFEERRKSGFLVCSKWRVKMKMETLDFLGHGKKWEVTVAWSRKLAVEMNRREWSWDKFWRNADRIYTDRTRDVTIKERSKMTPRLSAECLFARKSTAPSTAPLHVSKRSDLLCCMRRAHLGLYALCSVRSETGL